ncbi:MAG: glycosyltransferase family 39 protein [Acidobacteriota bacterium]
MAGHPGAWGHFQPNRPREESAIGKVAMDPERIRKGLVLGAAALLLLAFLLNAWLSARQKTPTVDEFAHVPAGYRGLVTGEFDLYGKTPPLARTLFALPLLTSRPLLPEPPPGNRMAGWYPWSYATGFFNLNVRQRGIAFVDHVYGQARLVVIGLALLLGAGLFSWARRLHGPAGGLLALALFTFDPNILAHARLATVDLPETLFFFAAVACFTLYLAQPGRSRLAAAGLLAGAALSSKFTAVLLVPIWIGMCLIRLLHQSRETRRALTKQLLQGSATLLLLALLVVNASYAFAGSFRRLGDFQFRSTVLSSLEVPWLRWMPVPVPRDFLRGLDAQQVDVEEVDFPNYLAGQWSRSGWWYYYPVAWALKTPLPASILILVALALTTTRRFDRRRRLPVHDGTGRPPGDLLRQLSAWAVGLSIGVVAFAACFLNRLDIGVRYLLPLYPFLFLGVASLGRLLRRREPVAGGLILAALTGAAISTLAVYPHYLSYFNLLAGGPSEGWRILINSNNDWGQDLKFLRREIEARGGGPVRLAYFGHAEPEAYGIDYTVPLPGGSGADALLPGNGRFPHTFSPGLYAISANLLAGFPYLVMDHGRWIPAGKALSQPQEIFSWFRKRVPFAVIGGSILLFVVEEPPR